MIAVESTRQEWEEAYRRFQDDVRDPARRERLHAQVEVVTEELRRRVGRNFTLAELVHAYTGAERWVREAVEERSPAPGWAQTLALAEGVAFHLYQRGATDYTP